MSRPNAEFQPDPSANGFAGRGWSFPIRVNVQGGLQFSAGDRNIEESIWLILRTDIGERVGEPEFGSNLSELSFSSMNVETLVRLKIAVEDALVRWEPRIVVEEVQTDPDPVRGCVNLVISYRRADDYDPRSLVYPFYLQPQDAIELADDESIFERFSGF